ncbi:Transmembrane and ubiquitin-like domain-containing protein 2 [Frankliniella fusca]|uniref:Transmembrane and ubiquitin-like domain-containing protein 2 n=1 Tax=Frankliniella fusca TaxID=407009 RepID=A0AAE1H316_9NEOP|nr:Transmembrane and ubiquitin-like domain-containing protein 2 [Frankliniella fusca]
MQSLSPLVKNYSQTKTVTMPVIEGVGDEVFQVLVVALVIFLGIVGWWSTSISEQPLIRTVLILEPRHHASPEVTPTVPTPSPPQDTGQPDSTAANDVHTEAVPVPANASSASKSQSQNSSEQSESVPLSRSTDSASSSSLNLEAAGTSSCPDVSPNNNASHHATSNIDESLSEPSNNANELRRRRLQFFEERQGGDSASNLCSWPTEAHTSESHDSTDASGSSNNIQETLEQQDSATEATGNEASPTNPCQACDDIRIKLKFLNDNQKLVQGKLQEPLGDFKRRNFAVELAARKVIRLIFNGQVLQSDDRTLQNYGLFDNCVVHCLVHNQRTSNSNVDNGTNSNTGEEVQLGVADTGDMRDWDLSHILYISMFAMLSTAWYLRINFSQFFSATATVALFGLSGIFVIFLVGAYIPDQDIVLRT